MNISDRFRSSTPTKALFAFVIIAPFLDLLYLAHEISLPPLYETLYPFAFVGLNCWWLKEDSKRSGVTWPLDMGMYLYVAWICILPYHLFKTRGLRGGIFAILAFIGVLLSSWLTALFVGILLSY